MKVTTLNFAKRNKVPLFFINTFIMFIGVVILLKGTHHWFVLSSFPWVSGILVLLDIWISFCFFSSGVIDGVNLSFKRFLADAFLILIIFYNVVHVFLSTYFSYRLKITWFIFYGIYHLIFALALFFIYKNYKNKAVARSPRALREASYFIASLAVVFFIMMHFVLRDAEHINFSNRTLIYSFAVLTVFNLILSIYFVAKMKKTKNTNFIAHKYMNLTAAIISIFFVQTIYINEFCETISLHNMQRITMIVGFPCFIALVFLAHRLWKKAKIMEENK